MNNNSCEFYVVVIQTICTLRWRLPGINQSIWHNPSPLSASVNKRANPRWYDLIHWYADKPSIGTAPPATVVAHSSSARRDGRAPLWTTYVPKCYFSATLVRYPQMLLRCCIHWLFRQRILTCEKPVCWRSIRTVVLHTAQAKHGRCIYF